MKGLNPRTISVSVAAVAVAFVSGMALASHQQPASTLSPAYKTASDVSLSVGTDTTSSDPSTQVDPATTLDSAAAAASTPSSTNTTTDTSTSQSAAQSATVPAVVATDAQITDWSNPEPGTAAGSTVQHKYCVYSYSDGSTQQRLYEDTVTFTGGVKALVEPSFDCTVATAPAVN